MHHPRRLPLARGRLRPPGEHDLTPRASSTTSGARREAGPWPRHGYHSRTGEVGHRPDVRWKDRWRSVSGLATIGQSGPDLASRQIVPNIKRCGAISTGRGRLLASQPGARLAAESRQVESCRRVDPRNSPPPWRPAAPRTDQAPHGRPPRPSQAVLAPSPDGLRHAGIAFCDLPRSRTRSARKFLLRLLASVAELEPGSIGRAPGQSLVQAKAHAGDAAAPRRRSGSQGRGSQRRHPPLGDWGSWVRIPPLRPPFLPPETPRRAACAAPSAPAWFAANPASVTARGRGRGVAGVGLHPRDGGADQGVPRLRRGVRRRAARPARDHPRADRAERRRQDHLLQPADQVPAADPRHHPLRRARHHPACSRPRWRGSGWCAPSRSRPSSRT